MSSLLATRRARRWSIWLRAGVVVLLLTAAIAALYACHRLRQTPFMAGPDRISVCGRDFTGPGYRYTLEQLQRDGAGPIATVMTWQGHREIWGRHVTIGGAPGCGTGVYLKVGQDAFRGYALLGGP